MKKEATEKRIDWLSHHPDLVAKQSMNRRKANHDYCDRCVYMVTMSVAGRKAILGKLRSADENHAQAWVEPSELGIKVIEQWSNISVDTPQVKTLAFQLMPDHVHGIIFVTSRLSRHVGHVISRFKAKSTAAFRSLSKYSETESRKINLWNPSYNDRILTGKGQLKSWTNYLIDNPRRLWVKREHPELFTAYKGITIGTNQVTVMGNTFLLNHPYRVAVKCSRSMTSRDVEDAYLQYLSKAQDGAVLVSPCISPGEKEIMRRAFDAGFPLIILLENGFAPMQKPSGRQFDACSQGRLLLVAPWKHHNQYRTITREQCLALNSLAAVIASQNTYSH